jgi:hypothetical protein
VIAFQSRSDSLASTAFSVSCVLKRENRLKLTMFLHPEDKSIAICQSKDADDMCEDNNATSNSREIRRTSRTK